MASKKANYIPGGNGGYMRWKLTQEKEATKKPVVKEVKNGKKK